MALPLFCLILAGCEWSSGGGATTWNDRENFVDFSGSYKASDSGMLVRHFGASSTTNITTSTNTVTTNIYITVTNIIMNTVSGEVLGTGDGTSTAFSARLAHSPPLSGTLTIVVGGYRFNDPGIASAGTIVLTVTPADGSYGTMNFDTGIWGLSFPSPIASGTQILGAYQYMSTNTITTTNTISSNVVDTITNVVNISQGNHGNPIYSFVLNQQGNKIQILDSCGSTYEGTIGSVRTTGGVPIDLDPSNPNPVPTTGPIVAQFSATGYSQGYNIQIVGVLQGTLTAPTTLSGRTMKATFIEEGGYDADVNGTAQ